MDERTPRVALVVLSLLAVSAVRTVGQTLEITTGGLRVDLAGREAFPSGGDQIPTGFAIGIRASPGSDGLIFEASWSGTWQTRDGSVCHGLVGPDGCSVEPVTYSGGVAFVSAGWRLPLELGDHFRLRVLPMVGLGAIRAKEEGVLTGRGMSELQPAIRGGVALDLVWQVGAQWHLVAGASRYASTARRAGCEDCGRLVGGSASQTQVAVGFGWRR